MFPTNEFTLNFLLKSLDTYLDCSDPDNPIRVGNDALGMHDILNFLSGYNPVLQVEIGEMINGIEVVEYNQPVYHTDDVIRALIHEIFRLRERLCQIDPNGSNSMPV